MQNLLRVEIERRTPEKPVVKLIGRLDSQTYKLADEHLKPLLTAGTSVLVLDLSGLTYLNSMGLRVIMGATKALAKHGGQCIISEPQVGVRAVLDIAKALPDQAVFASMAEADAYFDVIQRKAKEKAAGGPSRPGTISL
jgi:anti-anti-sigma factor